MELNSDAKQVMDRAHNEARSRNNSLLTVSHILWAITRDPGCIAHQLIVKLNGNIQELSRRAELFVASEPKNFLAPGPMWSNNVEHLIEEAKAIAHEDGKGEEGVGSEHILLAMCMDRSGRAATTLNDCSLTKEKLVNALQERLQLQREKIKRKEQGLKAAQMKLVEITTMILHPKAKGMITVQWAHEMAGLAIPETPVGSMIIDTAPALCLMAARDENGRVDFDLAIKLYADYCPENPETRGKNTRPAIKIGLDASGQPTVASVPATTT